MEIDWLLLKDIKGKALAKQGELELGYAVDDCEG